MTIAIVGLDAYFGTCRDGREFARAVAHGLRCEPAPDALRGVELALRVADNALFDADVTRGARGAVLWAGDATVAAEIAALWGFTGLAAAMADGATALLAARQLLMDDAVDIVLIGETAAAGGVALVLSRAVVTTGRRVYALIQGGESAAMDAQLPGYLDWPGLTEGVLPAAGSAPEPTCALGSVATNLGDAAPALAALARTALCLYHRVIPATPDWRGPNAPQPDSPFYVAPAPQPWLTEGKRVANCELRIANCESRIANHELRMTNDDVVLSEPPMISIAPVLQDHLAVRPFFMFPLAADDQDGVLALAAALRARAAEGAVVAALADDAQAAYQARLAARYALAVLAHDRDELLRELDFAVKGVEKAFAEGQDWSSPLGSNFTAQPLGRDGGVAFVYPGAFSSYVGMGRDLFQLFPHLHARFAELTRYASRVTAEKLLYPRHLCPPADNQADDARLRANPIAMIESGASFAVLYTAVLRDVFSIQPSSALGYSLGEMSMLWALGVWPDGDASSDAWHAAPLFKTRLAGPQEAVREYWGLAPDIDETLWCNYIVKAPAARVRRALEAESRVSLTMVNEEKETVIAGHPEACARVIAALDCHALRLPFDAAIHAPAARSEYAAFVTLYTLPTRAIPAIDFYSAAEYAPLTLERDTLARALAEMSCSPVDFPRLVRAAYDGGARIFVEIGPLGACSRWITRILRGQPHAVVAANRSGKSDYDSLLPVLALLTAQRVRMGQEAGSRKREARIESQRSGGAAERQSGGPADQRSGGAAERGSGGAPNKQIPHSPLPTPELRMTNYAIEGHLAFLQARQAAMQQTAELMGMQIVAAGEMMQDAGCGMQDARSGEKAHRRKSASANPESRIPNDGLRMTNDGLRNAQDAPLFTTEHLRAFGTGDVVEAFGPAYAHYRGRRVPRLPNGDLLCMSRVLTIDAPPGKVTPGAALVSEFDVRPDAWFFRDRAALPIAVLMETALQPCGVLSTYLGSMLPYPESDFYFRNLDGEGELLRAVDVRGQTILNRVTLLSSTALPGIILQKFSFELACAGEVFYRGAASFGYFTPEALQRQTGLDNGAVRHPWLFSTDLTDGTENPLKSVQSVEMKRVGQLDFLDKAWYVPDGGEYGRGYVYAEVPVTLDDWFFGCHFYQDPVMPGSLGVEALVQAMQLCAPGPGGRTSALGRTTWKYRGQVPPESQRLRLEVHVKERIHTPSGVALVGDGSLWRGELRIYEVRNVGLGSGD
ncbi:MAG TPA: PfaB family protein [Anaerolineae bacterium]|nr:PfaB family protein [Anaerolineae bacterium]